MTSWLRFEQHPSVAGLEEVPKGYVPAPSATHVVKRTPRGTVETWSDVAAEHKLDVWRLIDFNFPGCGDRSKTRVVNWYLRNHWNCPLSPDGMNRMFQPGMTLYIPAAAEKPEAPAPRMGHDARVTAVITSTIDEVYGDLPEGAFTVSELLEECRGRIVKKREQNGLDLVLRDAEYYFIARWLISERKHLYTKHILAVGGLATLGIYNLLKTVLPDGAIRTDQDNPNSPPGGGDWVDLGSRDGFLDQGSAKSRPRPPSSMAALRKRRQEQRRLEIRREMDF
jgi:hypothetical protein